jgi:hypothetical protein
MKGLESTEISQVIPTIFSRYNQQSDRLPKKHIYYFINHASSSHRSVGALASISCWSLSSESTLIISLIYIHFFNLCLAPNSWSTSMNLVESICQ